jgi:hypothetical protein
MLQKRRNSGENLISIQRYYIITAPDVGSSNTPAECLKKRAVNTTSGMLFTTKNQTALCILIYIVQDGCRPHPPQIEQMLYLHYLFLPGNPPGRFAF